MEDNLIDLGEAKVYTKLVIKMCYILTQIQCLLASTLVLIQIMQKNLTLVSMCVCGVVQSCLGIQEFAYWSPEPQVCKSTCLVYSQRCYLTFRNARNLKQR